MHKGRVMQFSISFSTLFPLINKPRSEKELSFVGADISFMDNVIA